jgi:hypothetical protein
MVLSSSKWDHPMLYLFGFGFDSYSFLSDFFDKILSEENKLYLKLTSKGEHLSHSKWLDASEVFDIIQKIGDYNLTNLLNQFEDDDYNGYIQLLTSFSQLKVLAEIEKNKGSKIQITFTFE